MKTYKGTGVSPGLAMGHVLKVIRGLPPVYKFRIGDKDLLSRELRRFDEAIQRTTSELKEFQRNLEKELGRDHSLMVEAHVMILQDDHFSGAIRRMIEEEHVNAEWALKVVSERIYDIYQGLKDSYLKEKIHDIQDIASRLLNNISGRDEALPQNGQDNVILVSPEMNLSLLGMMDFQLLKGFAVDSGGWTSHTSIIARSLEIPAVIHLENISEMAHTGDFIILDGSSGSVTLNPDARTLQRFQNETEAASSPRIFGPFCPLLDECDSKETPVQRGLDEIHLYINTEIPQELKDYQRHMVDGVGLYRSEFVFLKKPIHEITLEDHLSVYRDLAEITHPGIANIRTFDLGADKVSSAFSHQKEANPALGLRGIRLSMRMLEPFRQQLKAILLANTHNNLRITFPFISSLDEVLAIKTVLAGVNQELTGEASIPIPIGVMLEIPSTFFITDLLANEIDFFVLGTNDLIQFTLARDRNSMPSGTSFDSAHPAVRRGLEMLYRVARQTDKEIICCGEIASHPYFVLILLAIGYRSLSVNPSMLPLIRHITRTVDSSNLRAFYDELSTRHTYRSIEKLFLDGLENYFPRDLVQILGSTFLSLTY